jgi:hypothetical protein
VRGLPSAGLQIPPAGAAVHPTFSSVLQERPSHGVDMPRYIGIGMEVKRVDQLLVEGSDVFPRCLHSESREKSSV